MFTIGELARGCRIRLPLGVDQSIAQFEYPCYLIIFVRLPHIDLHNVVVP